jgi:hypothetical protein
MWTLVYHGPGDKLAEVAIVPPVQTIANYPSSEFNTTRSQSEHERKYLTRPTHLHPASTIGKMPCVTARNSRGRRNSVSSNDRD